MKKRNRFLLTAVLLSLSFIVGCSSSAAELQPTASPMPPTETPMPPTETPIPPHTVAIAEDVGMEITFDGSECTFSGPDSVPVGDYQFNLTRRNAKPSDLNYVLIFARILDGHSFQDLLDLQNDPQVLMKLTLNGAIQEAPSYADSYDESKRMINPISITMEGEYVATLKHVPSGNRVFCGPETLMVTAADSE